MDEACAIVCARNFHQCLWLPANASHERLRITYSTTTNFSDESLPAILFCTPMFGTRMMALDFDKTARDVGVRIAVVDRPGMGGSSQVSFDMRVKVWLEIVPVLLPKLGVQHVSLMSHSAGTIFLLNTLFQMPEILDPKEPYVAMIGPCVDHTESKITLLNLASKVPNSWIGSFNKVQNFVAANIIPAASFSGGIVSDIVDLFHPAPEDATTSPDSEAERYGTSEEVAKEINKLREKVRLAEDSTAGNEEARLCLKRLGPGFWGVCEDYKQYVRDLTEQRKSSDATKLSIRVFYAESDIMIGKGGQEYFEQCWNQPGVQETFDFKSEELPETTHDSCIADLKKGGLCKVLEEIKSLHK